MELLDNAERYNSSTDVDFIWRIDGDQLVVTIRNKAKSADAHRLQKAVSRIAAMTPDEITEAFKRQMTEEGYGEKGGAGLGMLQIARRVGKNIRAEISPLPKDEFLCISTVSTHLPADRKRA